MANGPVFRSDLYRGTARFYDEFRPPYPEPMFADLRARTRVTGTGRLLDLACGTGQVTFGLASSFAEVVAVDLEPETVEFGRAKAQQRSVDNVRWIAGRAEDVDARTPFDLVTIGTAFHRLPRRLIAESARQSLVSGGHLALLWADSPSNGDLEWQRVLTDLIRDWGRRTTMRERLPADLAAHLADEPHEAVLETAGFAIVRSFDFPTPYEWTVETLTGFMHSTSIMSQAALGSNVDAFERDLRARMLEVEPEGIFREEINFSYTLATNP